MSYTDSLYTHFIQLGRAGFFQDLDWDTLTVEKLKAHTQMQALVVNFIAASTTASYTSSLSNTVRGGIWIVDHRNKKNYWSKKLLSLFERSEADGPPSSEAFFELVAEEAREETRRQFIQHLKGESGYTVYQPIALPSGTKISLFSRAHTRFSLSGEPLYTYGHSVTLSSLPAYIQQIERIDATQSKIINLLDEIIHFNEADVNAQIQSMLQDLGNTTEADRVYLSQVSFLEGEEVISNLFEWTISSVPSVQQTEQDIPLKLFGDFLPGLKRGEELFIPDVNDMPESDFKHFLLEEQVQALFLVPIVENRKMTGILGCDFVRKKQLIHYETSTLFQAAAKIIKGTYGNRVLLQENKKAVEEFSYLFSTMEQGVVYQNQEGFIVKANPAAEKLLGLSFAQMQGRTSTSEEWHAIRGDGSPFPGEEHPAMQALRTGEAVTEVEMGVFHPEKMTYVWILVSATPIFEGLRTTPSGVFSTFTAYTDLKQNKLKLQRQSELQLTLVRLSTSLIRATKEDLDIQLNEVLARVGEATGADRSYIFSYDWDAFVCHNTHEWCAPGTEPMLEHLQNYPLEELHAWTTAHLAGEKMHVPRIEAIQEDVRLYQLLEPQGIKSLMALPIQDGKKCLGLSAWTSSKITTPSQRKKKNSSTS
ncbi:multi-sensor hybrid histidine kinase [Nitritalea halalkaliphila LW7]|uniref:Multi-sensor hybrid histidine kinase n=1 Tax=Nitritalea halalkaliphila LW7 TaxID=1189621 RepID=I5BTE0_9BACT|nr:GAF domain-containing protein [Nitritalea halalkaliphila]EIM72842.1 multi-sensor hybrid histidine kinase [Nitritalea halalkaliphila LW7]